MNQILQPSPPPLKEAISFTPREYQANVKAMEMLYRPQLYNRKNILKYSNANEAMQKS